MDENNNTNLNAAGMGVATGDSPLLEKPAVEEKVEEKPKEEEKKVEVKVEDIEVKARNFKEEEEEVEKKPVVEGDMDPEDEARVQKMIDKKAMEQDKVIQGQNNEIEVNNFIVENPEFKEYKETIKKYAQHPAYKNVPVDMVAKSLAFDDAQAMGATKEREAQKKAATTASPGTSARPKAGGKGVWQMTNAEFNKTVADNLRDARMKRY